ncbi:MAG: ATP-dependent Clp protease proteolytic subunit [Chitinophagaceae bacterium]|nr:ATP-dependent Clp protease proteolytic subunit [Chitinophagaceae bacterium]
MAKNKVIKTPPKLFKETQNLIAEISKDLNGDFVSYWVSGNSRIADEDIIAFYEVFKNKNKKENLYIYIKSDGGSGEASLRIVNLLRNYYKKIIAFVPLDCASAATMLVLGADLIKMGPLAYLSAIDTSITHDLSPIDKDNDLVSVSQNELSRVINLWNKHKVQTDKNPYSDILNYIHPLVIGSVDRATSLSIKLTTDILSYHLKDKEKANKISNTLNSDYPSHSYPITIKEAKKIGLNVEDLDDTINDKLFKLNELYSEMAQLAYTDYDELNYHDNEILKVIEGIDIKLFYQKDKDWHYRSEEKR